MRKLIAILALFAVLQITQQKKYKRIKKEKRKSKNSNKRITLKKNAIILERIPEEKIDDSLQEFNITDQYQVAINPRDQQEFDLVVDEKKLFKNTVFHIAYIVKNQGSVQFQIMDMENTNIIYDIKDQYAFLGKLKFKSQQRIKMILRNLKYNKYCEIILGFQCQNCTEKSQLADKNDIDQNKQILERINEYKNKSDFVSKVFKEKQNIYLKNLKKAHEYILYWFAFEIAGIITIGIFQISAIKNILSNKNIF